MFFMYTWNDDDDAIIDFHIHVDVYVCMYI